MILGDCLITPPLPYCTSYCTIIRMLDLAEHFSSRAKVRALEILCRHTSPLPLRHVAYLCDLPVFSIQRALADLTEARIVLRKKRQRSVLYSMNWKHPHSSLFLKLFRLIDGEALQERTEGYHASARHALAFASESREVYSHRKRKKP
jgi:hypothetical protein